MERLNIQSSNFLQFRCIRMVANVMLRILVLVLVTVSLVGCATVDFDYPKTESTALEPTDTSNTYLGKEIEGVGDDFQEGYSGFLTLRDGIDAIAVRLAMAEKAERSIDAQYYLLEDDITGRAFLQALLNAADRGVRVRLLLDDMFTGGYDAAMVGVDSHPHFEVRIFNPFATRSARSWDGITDFSRINRRMHNKSFTVDNQITVVGGRNIADEYFGAREDAKFADMDVLAIGPVVQEVSDMFDSYWNHERSAATAAFADIPEDPAAELEQLRQQLEGTRKEIATSKYAEAVDKSAVEYIKADNSVFIWAPYTLAADSPDIGIKAKAADAESITTALYEAIASAEKELLIISPYFVPLKSGIEALVEIQARGVDVTIVTNSLASNNQTAVHGGYAPSRKPLLKAGVRIFELRADSRVYGSEIAAAGDAKATLHAKSFVIDRKKAFIGSFNFDPRSAAINTELGLIIESPKIAEELSAQIEENVAEDTFEVFLNEKGQLRWRGWDDGQEIIFDKEPQTTWGLRFKAGFYRILPIRGQL